MFKISKIEIFKNFLEKERPLNKGILTKLENNLIIIQMRLKVALLL